MTVAFDELQAAQFEDIKFPVNKITVSGGLRDHVHEYPHSPGGAPEKLGRKLYTIKMHIPALQGFKKYPNLWPEGMDQLRQIFEEERTAALVIPTLGTIQAYAINWVEDTDASIRNGVMVDLEFREDQSSAYLLTQMIDIDQSSVSAALAELVLELKLANIGGDFFSSIQNAANSLLAVKDQAELYANVIEAKAEGLSRLCQQADELLQPLNNPARFKVLNALHTLWSASNKLGKDALKLAIPTTPFVTAALMSVTDVSIAIYGDTSHAMDLMRGNQLLDPLSLPIGTVLKYYKKAS